MEVEDYKQ